MRRQTTRNVASMTMVLIMALSVATAGSAQESQESKPVVGVLPVRSSGGGVPEAINTTLSDTLTLTLSFIGEYSVRQLEAIEAVSPATLHALSAEHGLDNVVFGTTRRTEDGSVEVELGVYNRHEDRVTERQSSSVSSAMAIFETADTLARRLIEGFADVRIEYGQLLVQLHGLNAGMEVVLDDVAVEPELGRMTGARVGRFTMEQMIAGSHTVRVRRGSTADDTAPSTVLLEERLEVRPGETTRRWFDLPLLEPERVARLKRADGQLARMRIQRLAGLDTTGTAVSAVFGADEALELLAGADAAQTHLLRERYRSYTETGQKVAAHRPRNTADVASRDISRRELAEPIRSGGPWTHGSDERKAFSEFVSELRAQLLAYRSVPVDGRPSGWEDLEPLRVDPKGDRFLAPSDSGVPDITAVYLAMDERYLYLRYDFANAPPFGEGVAFSMECPVPNPSVDLDLRVSGSGRSFSAESRLVQHGEGPDRTIERGHSAILGENLVEARFPLEHIRSLLGSEMAGGAAQDELSVRRVLVSNDLARDAMEGIHETYRLYDRRVE